MVFSSVLFVFWFFPLAIGLLAIAPPRFKNAVLLGLSLVFYAWGEVRYILIMLVSIALDYTCSNAIERYRGDRSRMRRYLAFSVMGNLGLLFFFKYADFVLTSINALSGLDLPRLGLTLPLGISFYTFQTMAYTIDVYRGKFPAERNLIDFGAFVCLFPQLIAGPIVTYGDIRLALKAKSVAFDRFGEGFSIFLSGLAMKVLLANSVGQLWDDVLVLGPERIASTTAWLGLLAFGLQIYFDFNGYSKMAIGLGKMLGFEFPENFNYPYLSKSFTEFWTRWHITLGSWFKNYLYFPLGGNRKGMWMTARNLLIVWFLTGLWHGADYNFILWGLYFFGLIALEKWIIGRFLKQHPFVARSYFVVGILIGWAIFAITDLAVLGAYLRVMFSFSAGAETLYFIRNYGVVLILGLFFCFPVLKPLMSSTKWQPALKLGLALASVLAIAYLVDSTYNPFLYFRF
jgi:alginate O-acetyltransferase complex protein AlgI